MGWDNWIDWAANQAEDDAYIDGLREAEAAENFDFTNVDPTDLLWQALNDNAVDLPRHVICDLAEMCAPRIGPLQANAVEVLAAAAEFTNDDMIRETAARKLASARRRASEYPRLDRDFAASCLSHAVDDACAYVVDGSCEFARSRLLDAIAWIDYASPLLDHARLAILESMDIFLAAVPTNKKGTK